ncbi:MAG: hypothetical protein V4501_08215 [Pseudomonadota bacterium]
METLTLFDLRIDGYTPKTLPMKSLVRYLDAFAQLLGSDGHVHFDRVRQGSAVLRVNVDEDGVQEVESRLSLVENPDAPEDIIKAYKQLNDLLKKDGTWAELKSKNGAQIIEFPGCKTVKPQVIGPVKEMGELEGELVRVGGKDRTAHLLLIGEDGQEYKVQANRDIAKRLGGCLYSKIKITGVGTWYRIENGKWELRLFVIQDFELYEERTLKEAISDLRNIHERSEWAKMDDPLAEWLEIRGQ